MIDNLDDALEQLLIQELPIKGNEIEIAFDMPTRDWASRLSKPTLNLYLYDIRENRDYRNPNPAWNISSHDNSHVMRQRKSVGVDLYYMVTTWAMNMVDEHRLLGRAMMSFYRTPELPPDLITDGLGQDGAPIRLLVAQQEQALNNPGQIWSSLNNEMRPCLMLKVTMPMNPYLPVLEPLVMSVIIRPETPALLGKLADALDREAHWTIGGLLQTEEQAESIKLVLLEKGLDVPVQPEGRFVISNLRAGDYTLEISVAKRKAKQYKLTVPSEDYVIELD